MSIKPPSNAKTYGKIILTLENCLLPDAKLDPTPSTIDGLDKEVEIDLRILGCELIQTAGILLKLPQVAMATGQVLFQRFYYSKSFVRHHMETTAMSCICLASKIEEAPRRIRDVINVFHHIKQVRAQKDISPLILDQSYIALKTHVIKAERRVLKELGFCVHVKHPHKLIVMYLQVLGYEKNQKIMQIAWNFMNDSLRTDVFVRYQPETIACACIYLTGRKLNIPLPSNPSWYEIFKVTEEHIVDVCYRILALYKRSKPNVDNLEDAVNEVRKKYLESRSKKSGQNTPPAVVIIDRSNGGGTHNAWGGFISRTLPQAEIISQSSNVSKEQSDKNQKRSYSKSRSRSRSRSQTPSPTDSKPQTHHSRSLSKKQRNRSRTPPPKSSSKNSKKQRNHSRSPSQTPPQSASSKLHRKNEKRRSFTPDRDSDKNYTNGDRSKHNRHRDHRERERSRDRKDKSYSNKTHHRLSKHSRDRERDRKR